VAVMGAAMRDAAGRASVLATGSAAGYAADRVAMLRPDVAEAGAKAKVLRATAAAAVKRAAGN